MYSEAIEDIYPLSSMQQGMLFHSLYSQGSGVYVEVFLCTLHGHIPYALFERAWQQVVNRHQVLRTAFLWEDIDEPLQVVHAHVPVHLTLDDVRALGPEEQRTYIQSLVQDEHHQGFDLTEAPLLRLRLVQLTDTRHTLVWCFHHIILDGWSVPLLLKEVFTFFEAYCLGRDASLPLPKPYSEYIAWLSQRENQEEQSFWQRTLEGFTEPTPLTMAHTVPPSSRPAENAEQRLSLSREATRALRDLARQERLTLNTLLLGAWALLLGYYSGQDEVLFGTTLAGRPADLAGVEEMLGLFITTVPVRVPLPGQQRLLEWLHAVQGHLLEVQQHGGYPLPRIQAYSQVPPGLPLFESLFLFENYPVDLVLQAPGIQVEMMRSIEQTNYPLTFAVVPGAEQLSLRVLYERPRFEEEAISRLLSHLQTLLQGIASDPTQKLEELRFLHQDEYGQLLIDRTITAGPSLSEPGMHRLFEIQVERTPDAIALVSGENQFTYHDLNERANQLARYLQGYKVGAETLVGICMERSADLLIGILGILKSGGAYVPLDPAYPQERLSFTLEDSRVSALLTQQHLTHLFSAQRMPVLLMDKDWSSIEQEERENLVCPISPKNLSYIIYTSGSTGTPKGVAISHESVLSLLYWACQTFSQESLQGVVASTSICFDLSVFEIFVPLSCGGTVILIENILFLPTLADSRPTLVNTVPSLLAEVLETSRLPENVLVVNLAGEALPNSLGQRIFRESHARQVFNLYGPSEDTTYSTFAEVFPGAAEEPAIGKPLSNKYVYILDPHLRPLPVGVPGELYLGGIGLARGYVGRPDLTAERFIPDLWSNQPGARLYRTGDKARYRRDGSIEFLGRFDQQVKVRGVRIELGEVEAALERHEAIRQAVVMAHEDSSGRKRLIAYLLPKQEQITSFSSQALRGFLQAWLPNHMIPSAYVTMSALPLTPNGKLDRKALPLPQEEGDRDLEADYVAPRTPLEQLLVSIWQQVLGKEKIGVYDNFFDLGGDSLLSLQIIGRASQHGLKLTLKHVFQNQTIDALAKVAHTPLPSSAPNEISSEWVPFTPIQRWFFEQGLSKPHHWNQAMLFELLQPLDASLLEAAFIYLQQHHDALRMRCRQHDLIWQASSEVPVALLQKDLTGVSLEEQAEAIMQEASKLQASLNLEEGPLMRVALFHAGGTQPDKLLIIMHHLIVDHVSWSILLEDLQTAYHQLSLSQPAALPPPATTFYEWAKRLAIYAQSGSLQEEQAYWIGAASTSTPSPVDFPTGISHVSSTRSKTLKLSGEESQVLLQEVCRFYHARVHEVLLTALQLAFNRYSGTDTLLIDLEGHGREPLFDDLDVSRTIGWFTTLFPIRLQLRDDPGPGEALMQIKEHLSRIPNNGIGYGLLSYMSDNLPVQEQLRRQPKAEISFNYLGHADRILTEKALFRRVHEPIGPLRSPSDARYHGLEITAQVRNGCIEVTWLYNLERYLPSTIERLLEEFSKALRSIRNASQSTGTRVYTSADFPYARLSQEELNRLVTSLPRPDIGPASQPISAIEDMYALSPMQQGMLFHTLSTSEIDMYARLVSFLIDGALDIENFEKAWQRAIDQHPVLRTSFHWKGLEYPVQVVHEQVKLAWKYHDWRMLMPMEQEKRAEALVSAERRKRFDLSVPPLLRLTLIQRADTSYQLVFCYHHLLLDGWSLSLLLKDVTAFYIAFCESSQPVLRARRPYSDYISWLSKQDLSTDAAFWQKELAGIQVPASITGESVEPTVSPDQDTERLSLSREATRALRDLARQERLTLNTLLLGAWALLLGYYSGQDEVLFGTTLAGRPADLAGVEEMLGLFITTVPVRVLLPGQQRLLEWLHAVQGHLLEVQQHGGYPLPRIQAYSQVPPGLPLFESLLVLEDYPGDNSRLLWGEQVHIDHSALKEQTNYPLTLVIIPAPSLRVTITYDGARFKKHLIRSLLEHFALLLESIVAHPEQVLGDIPCLGEDERQQVLVEWNATQAPKGGSSCLHHLFEAQAERTPKAVAVISGEQQITYQELNDRANHLGLYLRHLGVGPEVLVGICVERSPDMLVGLLGILKAGGAYVPVDPSYPQDRRDFMLQDARVSFVLAQRSTLHILETAHIPVVCMDELEQGSYSEGDPIESGEMSPQHLAYVIYTSGSTGKPKGVAITHASAVTLMQWARDVFPREALTGVLAGTSLCFDLSVFEIFVPLSWGGTIVLAENVLHLVDLPDPGVVKMINTVPSVLTELVYARPLPESIRIVNLAGESLSPRLVQQLYQQQTVEKVFNLYGPSEDTTYSTYSLVTADETGSPPIGKPIHNTQAYVLNARLEPVPIGVIGELYLGGEGLARGYLHRPEITAERFVPHPWSGQPGTRLYRTGDLVRYRPDGNLEFLGRLDRQVKVRGYRIELGEIEAVLTRHPAVNEAVVIVREDKPAEKQLVAYLIAKTNDIPGREVLQRFLQAQIPNYMLPAAFVWLKSWPLSPHGKLDRNALPPPDGARHGLEAAYVAPRNEIEHTLAAIWQDVLHLEKVGLYDNFFDLGGSSLLLLRVQSRLQEALGREIALLEFFNYPTIYALSEYISLKEPARATEEVFRRVEKRRNTSQRQRQRVEAKKKEL